MKRLWAPWRMTYILGKKEKNCFFCVDPRKRKEEEHLILFRGRHAFVMMNKFPYNNGHLMVAPNRHCFTLEELRPMEFQELFRLLQGSIRLLKSILHPQGFNIGLNLGKVAGAGEKHLHVHIVPRWAGDTNFMPLLGETKVVPEHLSETYRKLHAAFKNVLRERSGGRRARKK